MLPNPYRINAYVTSSELGSVLTRGYGSRFDRTKIRSNISCASVVKFIVYTIGFGLAYLVTQAILHGRERRDLNNIAEAAIKEANNSRQTVVNTFMEAVEKEHHELVGHVLSVMKNSHSELSRKIANELGCYEEVPAPSSQKWRYALLFPLTLLMGMSWYCMKQYNQPELIKIDGSGSQLDCEKGTVHDFRANFKNLGDHSNLIFVVDGKTVPSSKAIGDQTYTFSGFPATATGVSVYDGNRYLGRGDWTPVDVGALCQKN